MNICETLEFVFVESFFWSKGLVSKEGKGKQGTMMKSRQGLKWFEDCIILLGEDIFQYEDFRKSSCHNDWALRACYN